jgi:hypothetical protein
MEDLSMMRFRLSWLGVFSLALLSAVATEVPAHHPASGFKNVGVAAPEVCTVYALKDLGDDPSLGKWIAETIPQVIKPGSWQTDGEQRQTLCYYPQGKVLVVYHTPAVQAEVAAFLASLKKALPAEKETQTAQQQKVAQVGYISSTPMKRPETLTVYPTLPYPVPPPLQAPKHLFHMILRAEGLGDLGATGLIKEYSGVAPASEETKEKAKEEPAKGPTMNPAMTFILRYEGEGIIDNTVAEVIKDIYKAQLAAQQAAEAENKGTPRAPRKNSQSRASDRASNGSGVSTSAPVYSSPIVPTSGVLMPSTYGSPTGIPLHTSVGFPIAAPGTVMPRALEPLPAPSSATRAVPVQPAPAPAAPKAVAPSKEG